jgi:endoribonuclease Dicer
MESLLGAAFCSGGLQLSLKIGTRLGLCFGGEEPWEQRYTPPDPTPSVALLKPLETKLGYQFNSSHILREALTHTTFESIGTPSYQRLEFLGDGESA